MTEKNMKQCLKDESFWLRLPFMLLFFIVWRLTELVLIGIILVQIVFRLFKGEPQLQLLQLGSQLTLFSYQVFRYLTFNTEAKPFPFADWPNAQAADANPYVPSEAVNEDATPSEKSINKS
ncbi:MAG TPA: DUF4389 domain-containing protein [Marinospirillum sp.]|uniref:DUF4389 domain-containing protein n=1 Tax=Marinospirillum sp. TaxID=2183934 RepID=UPI002B49FF00|nr:DUF4389 domain-containing protein [Marinospirillum sp.]HKM16124.1 DUF4389 domain-containing protein [Marinospirillum sp.]